MTTTPAAIDTVAYQAWLEDRLNEEEAAEFLKVEPTFLKRLRGTPGMGPHYKRYSAKVIRYVRRDLLEWDKSHTCTSTLDYRKGPQASLAALGSPEGDEGGVD